MMGGIFRAPRMPTPPPPPPAPAPPALEAPRVNAPDPDALGAARSRASAEAGRLNRNKLRIPLSGTITGAGSGVYIP